MFSFKSLFGDENKDIIKGYQTLVSRINTLEEEMIALSDSLLRNKTLEFKERISNGATLDDILPEVFAVIREASNRTLGQRHFDVQLIGGIALHNGYITEMRTGEGKTLVATLPAYLNSLEGKGVSIVTVNDYLSRRDAVWMGQIYSFLGMSVGVINHESSYLYDPDHNDADDERDAVGAFKVVYKFLKPCTRQQAYNADITYGTNNEYGFDYLRDNIEYNKGNIRQRFHNYAIVDEVDSILIDEARTPLIISAPSDDGEKLYATFSVVASKLLVDEDYTVDEKFKSVLLTDEGISKAEKLLGMGNIYTDKGIKYVHHLETAVRAKALFHKDKEYVVRDDEVIIVDPFTGRMQPGRRWSEGLHQAIESKEGVKIQKESKTYASITFQNYFRMYKKMSGMTGTALTSKEEFFKVYGMNTVVIPTHRDVLRLDNNDFIFQTEKGKFKAVASKVKELNKRGQPVLIGTVSIEKNELLSLYLKEEGIKHELLNAKNHEREGEIVADAGKKGAVTIATNMAGRGVDIKLGGTASSEEQYEEIKALGGLFVLGTERHEARRIDNQLRGRSGRQGDPGETQFFVSMEDHLMRVFAADTIKSMMGRLNIPEDEAIQNKLINKALERAQEKIEGLNFDARKHVLEYDDVLNYQRTIIYARRREILLGEINSLKNDLEQVLESCSDEEKEKITKKKNEVGDVFYNIFRETLLQTIDLHWIEHLYMMESLRESVRLRSYGQRDPLSEYKKDGLGLFKDMQASIDTEVVKLVSIMQTEPKFEERKELIETLEGVKSLTEEKTPLSAEHKIGRNDLCHCGSGKKYKKCHGA